MRSLPKPWRWEGLVPLPEDVIIPVDHTRSGLGGDSSKTGPIMLQNHGSPIQYRNIWLLSLGDR